MRERLFGGARRGCINCRGASTCNDCSTPGSSVGPVNADSEGVRPRPFSSTSHAAGSCECRCVSVATPGGYGVCPGVGVGGGGGGSICHGHRSSGGQTGEGVGWRKEAQSAVLCMAACTDHCSKRRPHRTEQRSALSSRLLDDSALRKEQRSMQTSNQRHPAQLSYLSSPVCLPDRTNQVHSQVRHPFCRCCPVFHLRR